MAIRFLEGCDGYTTEAQLRNTMERAFMDFDSTGGRFGGNAFYGNDTSNFIQYQFIPDADETNNNDVAIGFWYKAAGKPSISTTLFWMLNTDREGAPDFDIESWGANIDTQGFIEIVRWQSNDLYKETFVQVCDNEWHWIEARFKGDTDGTDGVQTLYIDGMEITEVGTVDSNEFGTKVAQTVVRLYANTSSMNAESWMDDIIIYDDQTLETGDITPANDFPLGPIRVERLLANGAGTTTQLTASAGSNYQCVDDTTLDVNGDYVSSATSGHTDTYAFDNLAGSNINTIHGTVMRMWAKNGGAGGTIQGRLVCYSSATEDLGPDTDLYYAYTPGLQYCFPRDPNTAAAWTETNVNAAEFGFEVV